MTVAPSTGAPAGTGASGSGAPAGSAPSSGAPSSGAPSGPSGPSPAVSALFNDYPGLPSGSSTVPANGNPYPVPPAPKGNPSTPNIVPQVIANSQAPYNPQRDRNPITPDDVKRNAAFNRQLNANKAVSNLVAIIQRLTANVNSAKTDIAQFESNLKNAQAANNDCNNKVYDLANNATKVQNAIKDRQDRIAEANTKLADLAKIIRDLTNSRDALVSKRTEIENARSPDAGKLAGLRDQLKACEAQSDRLQKLLDDTNAKIADTRGQIKEVTDAANGAKNSVDLINQQLPAVDAKIADLQKQLADAQAQKDKLLNDRHRYQDIVDQAPAKLNTLNGVLQGLLNEVPKIQKQIADQAASCDEISKQLNDLRNAIAQKEADYKNLVDQINAQNALIKDRQADAKAVTDAAAGLPADIVALQQELARLQDASRNQYFICNDLADAVRKAQQNLDAINNKYTTEQGWLNDANLNL